VRDVWIRGAGMTRFARHVDRGARELVEEAVGAALHDAEVDPREVRAAYVGNAAAGLMTGQECIRGQVVLRRTPLMGAPIVNVENACASSSTALHLAWQAVAGGVYDCVAVVGFEKIDHGDRWKADRAVNATMDLAEVDDIFGPGAGRERNVYVDMLAASADAEGRERFDRDLLALVAVKNRRHGALNPSAHHQEEVTVEQVLHAPVVGGAVTRLMCAPMTDGAACLVLCAGGFERARSGGARIAASVLTSGRGDDMRRRFSVGEAARQVYEMAGVSPEELDVVELYDATAVSELHLYAELGLCQAAEVDRFVRDGVTALGGRLPVNPSGGLLGRGHAIGATGVAQLVELTRQLEGRCGPRQVPGARLALAENTGGWLGSDVAACCVHLLRAERPS
jgi:acetyl-CoA acetyltransferase